MNWNDAKAHIENDLPVTCSAAQSDHRNLLVLFNKAEELGLSPDTAISSSISNLRRILPIARLAADNNDTDELNRLFTLASTMNVVDLRLAIGNIERIQLDYTKRKSPTGEKSYQIIMDEELLTYFQHSLRLRFVFNDASNF